MPSTQLNVMTVHYNTQPFIELLVRLFAKENLNINFYVVDNSNNLQLDSMPQVSNVTLVAVPQKIRYANVLASHRAGLNAGLRALDSSVEHTLIIDPDVIFTQGALQKGLEYFIEKKLDLWGVHKHYQFHKTGADINYPYIWFTFCKTALLKNFEFQAVHGQLMQTLYRLLKKEARKDTGDSLYSLAKKNNLHCELIYKFPKIEQTGSYPFKDIPTDDWQNKDLGITISHYRGGSNERNNTFHKENAQKHLQAFIQKALDFQYNYYLRTKQL